jgi:hypothetical protein
MSWLEFHSASEKLAIDARALFRGVDSERALSLYGQAAELEQKALGQLDVTKARTRGITAVSAVALWFKAAKYARAKQLADTMLADPSIPEFAREQLRELIQAISSERSKASLRGPDWVVAGGKHSHHQAVEHHESAAKHYQDAAYHHREAAKHYKAGNHEKAAYHAHMAHGHHLHAADHAAEAAKQMLGMTRPPP